ncbi:SET domain-containing protein [Acerihabitans arboris]|uniref:Uncharacterized protein n=1 Tax=Acerihabitans arboris TaxID=2691583 RepID=A0A845SMY9_9GAMM|nr:SET domain-containing protein [Acerihabitans arboris]NDL64577.1 hypothetical protein [Acerihabitans arboris]
MDKIASPFIREFFFGHSRELQYPERAITLMAERFTRVQNCCYKCKLLWAQYYKEVDNKLANAFQYFPHPAASIRNDKDVIKTIAEKFVQAEDNNNFVAPILASELHFKTPIYRILEALCLKKNQRRIDEEQAKNHFMARALINGPLKSYLAAQFCMRIRARCVNYDPIINGLYPIRLVDGRGLLIKEIASNSMADPSSEGYTSQKNVKDFISSKKTPLERMKLYSHVSVPLYVNENPSIKKMDLYKPDRVIAREAIAKTTCVGLLAGTLIDEHLRSHKKYFNDQFVVDITAPKSHKMFLDCDGIMSKISIWPDAGNNDFSDGGAEKSCNVEAAKFLSKLEDGRQIYTIGIFAVKDIAAGEELRIASLAPGEYKNKVPPRAGK